MHVLFYENCLHPFNLRFFCPCYGSNITNAPTKKPACIFELTTGSKMLFLLRTAFWLTLVLVLIPLGSEKTSTPEQTVDVDPVSAFLAAQATVSDIGGFCSRNPQACETGGNALTAIGSRARDGAAIVYQYFEPKNRSEAAEDGLVTGSTSPAAAKAPGIAGNGYSAMIPSRNPGSKQEAVNGPVPRPKPGSGRKT